MLTEIFDERELDSETLKPEADEEAMALIASLGLRTHSTGERIAYPKPTKEQATVIRILFPTMTKLADYDAGIIPLRVLKEIRSYRAEHPAHHLYIAHDTPVVVADPVLIAIEGYEWNTFDSNAWRLIARWGTALDSWEKLYSLAIAKQHKAIVATLEDVLSRYKASAPRGLVRISVTLDGAEVPF